MNKLFVVDITENNTPIEQGAGPVGKKGSCGGRCGGKCGSPRHVYQPDRRKQLFVFAVIVIAAMACYFLTR